MEAYRAQNKRSFSQRIRRLRCWATKHIQDTRLRKNVIKLCNKKDDLALAYEHEGGRRTSNEVDRSMDMQDRQLYAMRGFAGKRKRRGYTYGQCVCCIIFDRWQKDCKMRKSQIACSRKPMEVCCIMKTGFKTSFVLRLSKENALYAKNVRVRKMWLCMSAPADKSLLR